MDARELFLHQHAIVHMPEVSGLGIWSFANDLVGGTAEELLRECPGPRKNSVVWLLWHTARTEDVAVNFLVARRPQVFDSEWAARLKLSRGDIGTGMFDDEISDFSARVDIPGLMAYRNAVGRRTREVVSALHPEELDEMVDEEDIARLHTEGTLVERALPIARFWAGNKKAFILAMPGSGHHFMHLSEAATNLRDLLRSRK